MKKLIATITAATLATVCLAQNRVGDIVRSGDDFFVYLTELKTPEGNDEFQRNISIIRMQNSALKHLKDQMTAEHDNEKKLYLDAQFKKLEGEYKLNEKLMAESYGFAPNRVYKQVYMASNICLVLKEGEIAELRMDGKPIDPQKMVTKGTVSMYRTKSIEGAQENEKLQNRLADLMNVQLEIDRTRKQLAETKDVVAQKSLNEKIVQNENRIKAIDAEIRKAYDIPPARDYAVEVANSRLYMLLNDKEKKDIMQRIAKAQKAAPKK